MKSGIRILMYHSVGGRPEDHPKAIRMSADKFREEMKELAGAGYETLIISEVIEKNLPVKSGKKYVALTFDDGYKDNATTAAEILNRFGFKATFFITTSYIDGESDKRWADGNLREYMTWADIKKLSRDGFEIGSHMVHHIDLTALKDDELKSEFMRSRDIILQKAGIVVRIFSYPYGKMNRKIAGIAKRAGYMGGCSILDGLNYKTTDRYMLRRTEISGHDTVEDFRDKIS